ncbi:MAG: patatin-like phospholipase family protein [Kiloniellales bacterium]|nr:patatin-like phospholipase family protein [Kiloniellales bacterium]
MSESGSGVLQRALGALQRRPERARRINLALQGGGAHGAFTWGVLDRLLDRRELEIDGVSGTSAGAVNAVALAAGYREDGTEGARRKLATVWRALSESGCVLPVRRSAKATGAPVANSDDSPYYLAMQMLTGIFSPYDFNPLEIDPLRAILDRHIDFKALRRNPPMTLFINATEVATGRGRVFTGKEITLEAVLASACLPALRHAVKIGRQHYWDGAFSANPALLPLIESCATADTLIVRLAPARLPELPKKASDIHGHVSRIMFSQPLRKEIELIETGRRTARRHRAHRQAGPAAQAAPLPHGGRRPLHRRARPRQRLDAGLGLARLPPGLRAQGHGQLAGTPPRRRRAPLHRRSGGEVSLTVPPGDPSRRVVSRFKAFCLESATVVQ